MKNQKYTPRQRCAICNPQPDADAVPHARHHHTAGLVDSILTFDVAKVSSLEDADESLLGRIVDGWYGVWHARASVRGRRPLKAWNRVQLDQAKGALAGLITGVGMESEQVEVHPGTDEKSLHVYKWATADELRRAMSERQIRGTELEAKSV